MKVYATDLVVSEAVSSFVEARYVRALILKLDVRCMVNQIMKAYANDLVVSEGLYSCRRIYCTSARFDTSRSLQM